VPKRTSPVVAGHAHERAKQRRLADAIAPEQRRHLPRRHLEGEVAQDVAAPVVLIEIRHAQHMDRFLVSFVFLVFHS
jgi:hypothetical protein